MLNYIALSLLMAANPSDDSAAEDTTPVLESTSTPIAPPPVRITPPSVPVSSRPNPVPRIAPSRWVTGNDYPSDALRQVIDGAVKFQLSISSKGRVVDCDILESSNHLSLDIATCKNIYRRARFWPALDRYGNPIIGKYLSSVRWQIPDIPKDDTSSTATGLNPIAKQEQNSITLINNKSPIRPFPVPYGDPRLWVTLSDYPEKAFQEGLGGEVKFEVSVIPTGKIENCKTLESSGHLLLDEQACTLWKKYALFRPALDIDGNAITGRYIANVRWALPRRIGNGKPNLEITEMLRNYSAQPSTNPAMWIQTNDYPEIALAQKMEGVVGFFLTINKLGSVSHCFITHSSSHEALDRKTCDILTKRALFQPSLNKSGNPVEGHFINRVRWRLP